MLPLVLLMYAACPGPETDDTGPPVPPALGDLVDPDAYAARLSALAALAKANGDRLAGSVGEGEARDWAKGQLEELGWTVGEQKVSPSFNLVATSPFGTPEEIVAVGAHLDTVEGAPGMNDNGTGVAAVLGLAEALSLREGTPLRQVRLVLFTAEEDMAHGSSQYMFSLSDSEAGAYRAYLNLDMIGSPNGVPFLMDTDGSDSPLSVTELNADAQVIEDLLAEGMEVQGRAWAMAPFVYNSDHYWFAWVGIPTGVVQAGAFGLKTEEEAETFGGTAGEPYDACFHTPCDTLDNVDVDLALALTRAQAFALDALVDGEAL